MRLPAVKGIGIVLPSVDYVAQPLPVSAPDESLTSK